MNSMPFRQLKSFLKILIGVQYENPPIGTARPDSRNNLYPRGHDVKALNFVHHIMILWRICEICLLCIHLDPKFLFFFAHCLFPLRQFLLPGCIAV